MSDDLLERATRALRETSDEPNMRSGLTRARLLESAERKAHARRGLGARWALAAAGLLVAGTALARVADQLPALIQAIVPSAAPQQLEPKPKKRAPRRTNGPEAAPQPPVPPPAQHAPAPVLAPAVDPVAEPAAPPVRAAPAPRKPRRPPRNAVVAEPAQPVPVPAPAPAATPAPQPESAELALFRRAQRLHLAHDPQALAAWDAYLRVAALGALVPEARYNRALCLLRMGRSDDARAALAPFARGVYGAYRQAEAQRLLDALAR